MPEATLDPAALREAADWLVRLSDGEAGPADRAALQQWLAASPAHAQAWQRAESLRADLDRVGQAPGQTARAALASPPASRRAALGRLAKFAWVPLVPTAAWLGGRELPWGEGSADYRTATGEQRQFSLADGTKLLLNTASAVDLRYSAELRLLRLRAGEIRVSTAPGLRPFVVQTDEGRVRALGTRFTVRQFARGARRSQVAVFDGAVEITAGAQTLRLDRDQQAEFGADGIAPRRSADEALDGAWTTGMLIAQQMRLADLAAELDRYLPGRLRCHPDVAELRVSGAFPVLDAERSLRLLAATFPVRVRRLGPWWASIEPAGTAQR